MKRTIIGAAVAVALAGPAAAEYPKAGAPLWLCGPEFVGFEGRRWLPTSNARDKKDLYDETNLWIVKKRSIKSIRAFRRADGLHAFVALGLGEHRLSEKGRPIDIVISEKSFLELSECLARPANR